MTIYLSVKNIVLVGLFNPALFDKFFFIKYNIIKEEEILPGSNFAAIGMMQLVCNKFNLVITPNQVIISSTRPESDKDEISGVMLSIIDAGNIANVKAFGMNFNWLAKESTQTLEKTSKNYFYNEKMKLFSKYFISPDSMYGVYASTNFKGSRLKLDIKPTKLEDSLKTIIQEQISFAFNFHFDIKNSSNSLELIKYLTDYSTYREQSEQIISIYK